MWDLLSSSQFAYFPYKSDYTSPTLMKIPKISQLTSTSSQDTLSTIIQYPNPFATFEHQPCMQAETAHHPMMMVVDGKCIYTFEPPCRVLTFYPALEPPHSFHFHYSPHSLENKLTTIRRSKSNSNQTM